MFNSTHTLIGLAVARTGFDEWVPRAAITAVIASNLPDIDLVTDLYGVPSYLEYHRGITHSFIGILVLSLLLAGVMYIFTKAFWRTFVVALAAMATHPLLDYANTYGLRPFLPFDGTWYYGDALFMIDPILDVLLLIGVLTGQFFRKVRSVTAVSALVVAVLYIGNQVALRNEAQAHLDTFTAKVVKLERSAVLPRMLDPWTWDGIVETKDAIFKVRIDSDQGVGEEVARIPKQPDTKMASQAIVAPSASALLGFARFPVIDIEGLPTGYRVTFMDFRFYNEHNRTALAAQIELDRSLNIVKEELGFNQKID